MKLKSTLWALAFACAAVSCSDDLENGPGNENNEEENGKKAYMTVNISTVSDGTMTKAENKNENGAGWGEDGNDFLGELAGKKEAMVYDINVFLVPTTETTLDTNNHLTLLNTAYDTDDNKKILDDTFAGHGYHTIEGGVDASTGGNEPNHGSRNITITMNKDLGTEAQKFQVFAIVNAGNDLSLQENGDITTLKKLREYVLYKSVIKDNEENVASADKFIMSTHKMFGAQGLPSIVSLSSSNTAENPAQTAIYVERLAARIDLSYPAAAEGTEAGTLPNNNNDSPVKDKGTFKLTGYMVVNQWMGGTNMFKQVSPTVNSYENEIATNTPYADTDPVKYLGDEVWKWSEAKKAPGTYNFVWSPSFDNKKSANINTDGNWNNAVTSGDNQAYYKNPFNTTLNNANLITSIPTTGTSYTDATKTFYPIAYVRENTMNTKQQVNGFTTGVIFRTQFTPNDDFTMMEYLSEKRTVDGTEEAAGSISDKSTLESKETFQFLTAEHYDGKEVKKLVYKDVKTVAARAFKLTDNETKGLLRGFMDGWDQTGVSDQVTLTDIQGAVNDMSEKNQLSKKFKTYLQEKLKNVNDLNAEGVKTSLTYNAFVDAETDANKTLLNKELANYDATDIANLAEQYGIYFFRNGQSYHKFWIRHNDNLDDNKMGVMEFAIVRNNVYQLNVTGVRGLGDPLPFTPGKDDPKKPDESDEVSINVTIYVKDWVKRTNKDIIL